MFVCGIIGDQARRAKLQQVLNESLRCEFFAGPEAPLELLAHQQPDCLLVEPWDEHGHPTALAVERAHALLPGLPIIVYCGPGRQACEELLALGRAGARTVMLDVTASVPRVIVDAVRAAQHRAVLETSFALIENAVPDRIRPFVRYVAGNAAEAPHVVGVARGLGLHRNTVSKRLRRANLPPAERILPKLRLLAAVHMLETTGRSVEAVAFLLHFGTGANMSAAFRRHFGLTASEAATLGIVQLRRRVIDSLRPRADDAHESRRDQTMPPDARTKRRRATG